MSCCPLFCLVLEVALISMSYIKDEFVKRVLQDEGKRLIKNQGAEITRRLKFHSNRLFSERTISVSGDNSMDGQLSYTHTAYQRFLDIKRKIRSKQTNRTITRRFRIHNRYIMGHYYSIANRLMNEMTEEVVQSIKKDFQNI